MAANKQQGQFFTLFLASLTVLCMGLAGYPPGLSMVFILLGAIGFVGSLFGFMKIKILEGAPAVRTESAKLIGAAIAGLGWLVTLVGLHFVDAVGGRIVLALVGIAVSLFGIVVVLPATYNKSAFWKA
jgi:hypothetical protein